MKINIPKVVKQLRLADYEPAYGDAAVNVHCNPSREELAALRAQSVQIEALRKETLGQPEGDRLVEIARELDAAGQFFFEWYARNWSQGADPETHWTADEVRELYAGTKDVEPGLWPWLTGRTLEMITDYRSGQKKA